MSLAPVIRHIMVPHDFGDAAEHALAYALDLGQKLGARVTVVHAFEVPAFGYPDALVASLQFLPEIEAAAGRALDAVKSRVRGAPVDVEVSLRRGTPWEQITAAASEMKVDLIVMGTHGRRGVAHALLGSVAEKVVRTAPCPVLTVRAPEGRQEAPTATSQAR
jgi:nucleotide-binding universal stress UspA family protein